MRKLILKGLLKIVLGFVLICLLLFLPAGTFYYYQGWLFIIVLFVPILIVEITLCIKNPQLLEKRLNSKETKKTQQTVIKLSGLMFIVGFILSGLNFRYNWIVLPFGVSVSFVGVFIIGYALYAEVLKENEYLSRTIEVQKDQKVIDTGVYGAVRHPMYSATLLLFMSMPFILGSVPSILVFLFYPFLIAKRIKNEEIVLKQGLPGYENYIKNVKYRLIPFIW